MEGQGVLFDSQTTRKTVFGTSKDLGHVLRIAGCIHVLNNTLGAVLNGTVPVVREEVDIDSMRSAHRRLGAKGSYVTLVRVADRII